MSSPTCSLDAARDENPALGFALYAYEPGGPVTLEIIDPDGQIFSFVGATASEALAIAFPPAPPEPATPSASIFD